MTTYVALLRGINVSGKNLIKMAALRALVESLGYERVQTYIQSGNIVFDSPTRSTTKVVDALATAIAREFALDVQVLARTNTELSALLMVNPLTRPDVDTAKLHVTFLASSPAAETAQSIDEVDTTPDEFAIVGREVFVHCPNGYGNTKLNNTFFEKKLGVAATTRNWRTVQTLASLADSTQRSGATP